MALNQRVVGSSPTAPAAVDEYDAPFMIGAGAAFVSYMINKATAAGLLKPKK